ncbi:MAG TPA: hypothetical protein VJ279_08385 [Hanamia sp.]|jgi:hypothetical protein|nr:hypothetical protein [Hanamia sp.]
MDECDKRVIQVNQKKPIDKIIIALSLIVEEMKEGGIDQFDLSVGESFMFSGKRK